MAFQTLMNILIAGLWTFLQNSYTLSSFVFGYIIGLLIIFALRGVFAHEFYLIRVWAFVKLMILFIVELTKSNIDMVKVVLRPKLIHQPSIFAVRTRLETPLEITLLAALISLTPGTISMDFSKDNRTIYIHAIDMQDREEAIEDIRNSFERAILEVTR